MLRIYLRNVLWYKIWGETVYDGGYFRTANQFDPPGWSKLKRGTLRELQQSMSLVALGADKTHEFKDWLLKHSDPVGPRFNGPDDAYNTREAPSIGMPVDYLFDSHSQGSIRDFYNS